MLLAVDVGNSNTSIGVFEGAKLRCELRLTTRRDWTRDEFAIKLERALALQGFGFAAIRSGVLACVVPPVEGPIRAALERYVGVDTLVVGPGVKTGMPVLYEPAKDVGADRIVAAVAAHHKYAGLSAKKHTTVPASKHTTVPASKHTTVSASNEGAREGDRDGGGPQRASPDGGRAGAALHQDLEVMSGADKAAIITVDFGTATTFDVISPTPEYLGGIIAPGVGISADALFHRAAKLPRVDVAKPPTVVGRNTVDAIQSGLFYGYVGLVEGVLRRIRAELAWEARVIATGGLARKVAHETDSIDEVDDNLMLEGLRLLYEFNRGG